jgi:hypothetical protein
MAATAERVANHTDHTDAVEQQRQPHIEYQAAFAAQTAAAALRERWGEQLVTLGTANTHTGQTTRQRPLREYLECVVA